MKFWEANMLLLQKRVPKKDVDRAEKLLREFVLETPDVYAWEADEDDDEIPMCQVLTSNLHTCWHLANNVRDWGALYSHSLFPFESFNGLLKNMFNGTQFLSVQVNNNFNFNLQLFMSLNVDQGAHLEDSLASSARDS